MKISDLVEYLEKLKEEKGDLEIETWFRGVVDDLKPDEIFNYNDLDLNGEPCLTMILS